MEFRAFCDILQSREQLEQSRLIAIPEGQECAGLINQYINSDFEPVYISEFVDAERYIAIPLQVFADIDERRNLLMSQGKKVLLLGLDGYLTILNQKEREQLATKLSSYLDDVGSKSMVVILNQQWAVFEQVLTHPKWRQGLNIVHIGAVQPAVPAATNIYFIPHSYEQRFDCFPSLRNYLSQLEKGSAKFLNKAVVAVTYWNNKIFSCKDGRGLSPDIHQLVSAAEILRELGDFGAKLSISGYEWVLQNTKTTEIMVELENRFFPNGIAAVYQEILKQWSKILNDSEREIYAYLLRTLVKKESYLGKIIEKGGQDLADFEPLYICPPRDILLRDDAAHLADERAKALREYGRGTFLLSEYISSLSDLPLKQILPWLNLGDSSELTEFLRRLKTNWADLELICSHCPEVAAYLDNVSCGDEQIDDYMSKYRQQKLRSEVTKEFATLARDTSCPITIDSRQAVLNNYKNDERTFLLVVDALGVEYLPYLVSCANERLLNIAKATCAQVHLPTSTEFNDVKLEWGDNRYSKFDELDHLLHKNYGSSEIGLSKEMSVIHCDVMDYIQDKLRFFERVVVTADHGSTRLAVLAYEQGLCQTLMCPEGVTIEDWRYGSKKVGINISADEFATTLADDKAIVKGYNRLPQPGGATFELHGGATLEELVVPVIVFTKGTFTQKFVQPAKPKVSAQPMPSAQMIENDDFDI